MYLYRYMIKMSLIVKYQLEFTIKGDCARLSSSLDDISLYLKQKKYSPQEGA